jgi:hypothetical protein
MAPIRSSVRIPVATLLLPKAETSKKGFAELVKQSNVEIDDLLWSAEAKDCARTLIDGR